MKYLLPLIAIVASVSSFAQKYPSADWQISTASLAAPEQDRENVTVLGYQQDGTLGVLKKGTNDFICLADDPGKKGFSVACYHKSLEPFMARGRELTAQGKNSKDIFQIREDEVKAGKLAMPDRALLYVLTGQVNETTQEVENQYLRYVFYIPFATAESTGLPLAPAGTAGPWIMDAGTHRAHIMINPPKPAK